MICAEAKFNVFCIKIYDITVGIYTPVPLILEKTQQLQPLAEMLY